MSDKKKDAKVLMYKNIPFVKRDNLIIFGNLKDEYYIQMTILDSKMIDDLEVADNILIELMTFGRSVKKAEREGIYKALDIAEFWLNDALEG